MDIVVFRRGSTGPFRGSIVGTMTCPLWEPISGDPEYFGIRFSPGGFFNALGIPARDFTDRRVPLECLPNGSRLEERIASAPDMPTVRGIIEDYVKEHTAHGGVPSRLSTVLNTVERTGDVGSIAGLARTVDCSPRHLRRLFHDEVGVGPKMFCRIARFKKALRALRKPGRATFVSVALDAGYHDQAHLIRDFKQFYGDTPSSVAKIG